MRERRCYACLEVWPHLRPHTTRRCPLKDSTMVRGRLVSHAPPELVPRKRLRSRGSGSPEPIPVGHFFDVDLFECPTCTEYFTPPVYQCRVGHITCGNCWSRIRNLSCSKCKRPVNMRCLLFDKIVKTLYVNCKYRKHGCAEILQCNKQRMEHERICEYKLDFQCPCLGCMFDGNKFTLPGHLREKHEVPAVDLGDTNQVRFKLEPEDRMVMVNGVEPGTTFLLHREFKDGLRGEIFFLTSFGVAGMECSLHIIKNYEHAREISHAHLVNDVRNVDDSREGDYLFHPFSGSGKDEGYQIDLSIIHAQEDQPEEEEDQPEEEEEQPEEEEDQPEEEDDQPEEEDDQPEREDDQPEEEDDQPEREDDQPEEEDDQPEREDDQPEREEDQPEEENTVEDHGTSPGEVPGTSSALAA